jgi:hypothetical protein
MAMVERELPKSLYVSPEVHKRASVAAAMLGLKLKDMTEQAVSDFIAKHNLNIPEHSAELSPVAN